MLFQSWTDLWHVFVVAVLLYPALIIILRASGKRTLGKMNAFDLVVTVAFGSILASVLVSRGVTVAAGTVALALLVGLQAMATWLSTHFASARHALKSAPTLLFLNGRMLTAAMRSQRVTDGEILQAIRSHGIGDQNDVTAVVLEPDGSLSVIPSSQAGRLTALHDVEGFTGTAAEGRNP